MITLKDNFYKKIVEDFFHNLAGKINIANFVLEMKSNTIDIENALQQIESIFILYRGVLIERYEIYINIKKILPIYKIKNTIIIDNNTDQFTKNKSIFLYLFYKFSDSNTKIIINDNSIIYENSDKIKIIEIEIMFIKEEFSYKNSFFSFYEKKKNSIIFYFIEKNKLLL